MKNRDHKFWALNVCVPLVIAIGLFGWMANYFADCRELGLTKLFVILLSLSFIGLAIAGYMCFKQGVTDTANLIGAEKKKGMQTKAIIHLFVSLLAGVIVGTVSICCGLAVGLSIVIGLIAFLLIAFIPMLWKKWQTTSNVPDTNVVIAVEDTINNVPDTNAEANTDETPDIADTSDDSGISIAEPNYLDKSITIDEVKFPAELPEELRKRDIQIVLFHLAKERVLYKDFRPAISNKAQIALLAHTICEVFDIPNKWKLFGAFWEKSGLAQSYAQAQDNQDSSKRDVPTSVFHALQAASKECDNAKLKSWVAAYDKRHFYQD